MTEKTVTSNIFSKKFKIQKFRPVKLGDQSFIFFFLILSTNGDAQESCRLLLDLFLQWKLANKSSLRIIIHLLRTQNFPKKTSIFYPLIRTLTYRNTKNNVWNLFPERRCWRRSSVFITNFEQISDIVQIFPLLVLNK